MPKLHRHTQPAMSRQEMADRMFDIDMSENELAKLTGVNRGRILDWLSGKDNPPRWLRPALAAWALDEAREAAHAAVREAPEEYRPRA